jgi:transposase
VAVRQSFSMMARADGKRPRPWVEPRDGFEDVPVLDAARDVRQRPPEKPKLDPLISVIEAILEVDRTAPMKQRHTAKRIFERLRDERGFAGGYTVVRDHVRIERARGRETFVPLAHPPGHAQVDFGEAWG